MLEVFFFLFSFGTSGRESWLQTYIVVHMQHPSISEHWSFAWLCARTVCYCLFWPCNNILGFLNRMHYCCMLDLFRGLMCTSRCPIALLPTCKMLQVDAHFARALSFWGKARALSHLPFSMPPHQRTMLTSHPLFVCLVGSRFGSLCFHRKSLFWLDLVTLGCEVWSNRKFQVYEQLFPLFFPSVCLRTTQKQQ